METGTSFMPKKTAARKIPGAGKTVDIFFLISIVIFLSTALFATGVFFYKGFLEGSIEEATIMLEREKGNFDTNSIKLLSRLDKRLQVADNLLNNHVNLTRMFEILETDTLKNVQFKSLDFSIKQDGSINIVMDGAARNYSTVALQSDIFGKNTYIKNPIFSGLDLDKGGNVIFNFSATIDKDLISYRKNFE